MLGKITFETILLNIAFRIIQKLFVQIFILVHQNSQRNYLNKTPQ